jgi:two-component system copper resistance phosphate regulon response regulator CusR
MARLLLVDDEVTLLGLLRRYLERQGHTVVTAESASAVNASQAGEYDLAIVDLTLPGASGEQVIAALRAVNPRLPAILTSGYPYAPQQARVAFLQKPFLPQMLVAEIEKLTQR